jgi:hypothetical protein
VIVVSVGEDDLLERPLADASRSLRKRVENGGIQFYVD